MASLKFKKKVGGNRNTRKRDSEDNEGKDESSLSAIRSAQKKQKLVQSTFYKRGLAVNATLKPEPLKRLHDDQTDATVFKEKSLFKTTFSHNTAEGAQSETIMQLKHQAAMEDFIQKTMNNEVGDEEEEMKNCIGHVEQEREADMGAGGTMLGGTGIAEVILPVEQRIGTAKRTEELRASLPMTFGKKSISSAGHHVHPSDVEGVAANFNFFRQEQQHRSKIGHDTHTIQPYTARSAPDDNRLGFQAARHGQKPPQQSKPHVQKANDDRVLKQFIKRERARR